jgi:hypothetical protein
VQAIAKLLAADTDATGNGKDANVTAGIAEPSL